MGLGWWRVENISFLCVSRSCVLRTLRDVPCGLPSRSSKSASKPCRPACSPRPVTPCSINGDASAFSLPMVWLHTPIPPGCDHAHFPTFLCVHTVSASFQPLSVVKPHQLNAVDERLTLHRLSPPRPLQAMHQPVVRTQHFRPLSPLITIAGVHPDYLTTLHLRATQFSEEFIFFFPFGTAEHNFFHYKIKN